MPGMFRRSWSPRCLFAAKALLWGNDWSEATCQLWGAALVRLLVNPFNWVVYINLLVFIWTVISKCEYASIQLHIYIYIYVCVCGDICTCTSCYCSWYFPSHVHQLPFSARQDLLGPLPADRSADALLAANVQRCLPRYSTRGHGWWSSCGGMAIGN